MALFKKRLQKIAEEKGVIPWSADPVEWIEKNFYVPELKGPLVLAPYQKAALREATRRDESGKFVYSTIVWSDLKKSIKSTIAAAVTLWRCWNLKWGQAIIVANDLKQADSRVGFYMRRAIELNPQMKITTAIRNYRIELLNRTSIEAVAIDPSGEAGSNADMVVFSELWGAHQQAQKRMWTEMTLPPAKFGLSQRWVETYAGYSGESPLLEQLYDNGLKHGKQLNLGIKGLEVYANEAARLFVLWNTKPRLPWQTPEYYAQESAILEPNEFQRVHRNQWVSSSNIFIEPEWWAACRGIIPDIQTNEPMIIGLDAGVASDCFAIVGVTRRDDLFYVRYAKAFYPPKGGKLDFAVPEAEIRRLAKEYNVLEWVYDEYQLHDMAGRLTAEGLGWFRAFPQGSPRAVADKHLQDVIRERRVRHPGFHDLDEHITQANAKIEASDKLRLVKQSELRKIDLAVALSMALNEAKRLNIG